jgi:ABC-type nitrate/sulfonate/bicarbonate transport system substrate-binding protein
MITRLLVSIMLGGVLLTAAVAPAEAQQFTAWGWPQPYEQVSPKSIDWLKQQGWWPLQYGYQAPWLGQATIPLVIKDSGLDKKRGLDIQLQSFLAGPPLNEAIVAGKIQIGVGGNFPLTTLIVRKAPVHSPGVVWTPVLEHSILVPLDSQLKKPADLKGKVVGLVAGSSAEFAFNAYLRGNGIDPKEVTIKSLPIPDQATMPKGIDAVVPWSPTPSLMAKYRKNARIFDDTAPFQLYWGTLHMRDEIFQNAPDVIQAVVDMIVEAMLIARRDVKAAVEVTRKDPALAGYPPEHVYEETVATVSAFTPAWIYPFVDVYAPAGAQVAKFLFDSGRLKEQLTEASYRAWFQGGTKWMDATFQKLGWKIPKEPPYFPAGMTTAGFVKALVGGQRLNLILPYKLERAQAFPEPDDLARRWSFDGKWYEPKK